MLQCPRCSRQFPDSALTCPDDLTPLQADATIAEVPIDPLIGRVFEGKYRLDQRLGGGGMGTVYRATHLLIDRQVAIKVLSQRFVGDQTAQHRFRREARAAGRMQHPNAVTVTDFGTTDDGWLYIVMELLEGQTLRDLLMREAPLDPARAVSFTLQACLAVGAAHEAGLIHRDLKPPNIFIEQRPNLPAVVKVLDFGVAKFAVEGHEDEDFKTLTQVGTIIGTPRYMSPEQCSGVGALTPASDVYSLGIMLYEMLTGVVPFTGETTLAIALKQVSEPPRPPREIVSPIPEELEKVVLHALQKNPSDRPANANDFRSELHATAELLGFEHAENVIAPTLEELRYAGKESPSGRLVIDLARLRQVQAASSADNNLKLTSADSPAAITGSIIASAANNADHPDFPRVQVPIAKATANGSTSQPSMIIALILIGLVGGAGLFALANRWRGSSSTNANMNQPASMSGGEGQAASPAPSPTPTPAPTPSPRSENRKPKEEPKKKESKTDSILNKVKRIFGKK